jgi:superfamily II helicase
MKKMWAEFTWPVHAFTVLGTAFSIFVSLNTMTQIYQANAIGRAAQAAQSNAGQQAEMTEQQIRAEFVKAVEQLVNNPQQVNAQVKQQFTTAFGAVLNNEQLRKTYLGNVANIFTCQKLFLTDALDSMKKKKEVKTPDRVTCETLAGDFFGRKTLLPEEAITANKQLIKDLSESRKPASGTKLPTEQDLKNMIQQQDVALQVLQFLFT